MWLSIIIAYFLPKFRSLSSLDNCISTALSLGGIIIARWSFKYKPYEPEENCFEILLSVMSALFLTKSVMFKGVNE